MGTHLEDEGDGQHFVVTCNTCGIEIVGTDPTDREDKRADAGWMQQFGDQDKCPSCQRPLRISASSGDLD